MINGLTDQRSDNGHILWHCQTVPAVHAAIRVLSGPARPGPNHCWVEAGLRKSYWVATKSVCSMMQATGPAAKEIPSQRECQPAPEEPTSQALCKQPESRADRQIWASSLQQENLWQHFLSRLLLQSGKKDQNHYVYRTVLEAWIKGSRKGEGKRLI